MNTAIKNDVQNVAFSMAFITNCTLILLIFSRSPFKLGTYKYLMVYFASVSLFYSFLECLLNPLLLSYKDCFQVIVKLQFSNPKVDRYILYYGCGICGVLMPMFVVHFIFRYFAMQRKGNLKYFEGWYFLYWLSVPLISGFLWAQTLFAFLYEDTESSDYMREILLENYGLNISDITYVGVLYYKKSISGSGTEPNFTGLQGVCVLGTIMTVCFCFIIYFGTLTYKRIMHLILEGRSEYTRRLQKQLYQALVIQTIIPIFFLILPLTIYFYSPLFHFGNQTIGDWTALSTAIYPIIDPLPVIFVIDNYRLAVLEFFGCIKPQRTVSINVTSSSNAAVEN
ncbi:Serpentine receptor class r-10 [Caenorhabditis elegans]|uniref:Serpentine receptor class r-10 n=1 Tax=Caenorhabditis elegans TaxID=6239 RepID=O02132_CAEEL|nr:Seven TM Receptor [Caenorhabditis elegans]CCD68673.1 Seven TM Receptor [Caenorhabditis elegans]|eukprot:NP_500696.1 Seven TM Receptor [Caenorhabditis elegans]